MESKKTGWPGRRTIYAVVLLLSLIGVAIVVRRADKIVGGTSMIVVAAAPGPAVSAGKSSFAQADLIFARFPVLTMIHITVALLFILLGPLQVSQVLSGKYPGFQRKTAPLFFICGFIMGATALVMSFVMPSIGGVNQAAATVLFGAFFLLALTRAVRLGRDGAVRPERDGADRSERHGAVLHGAGRHERHESSQLQREWLVRAYAIALAVTSVRLIVGIFFATSRLTGLKPEEFFGTAFWIGFVLHLILAEAWIYHTRTTTVQS